MQRILATSFFTLLLSATLAAQSRSRLELESQRSAPASCPVSMQAKQNAGWDMVKVGPGSARDSSTFQSIRLVLGDAKRGPISWARIKVHGLTDKPRVLATPERDGPGEMTRYETVSFSGAAMNEVAADLTLYGFTSIKSIDLISLTYSDGQTWKSGDQTCRTVPDPMMLIGTR